MIEPKFSFLYGQTPFCELDKTVRHEGNKTIYTTDDGLEVTLLANRYPEYNAVEWVIHFKYSGSGRSEIISEINDSDFKVELPMYVHSFKGNRLTEEAPKVVRMNGCVPGGRYRCDDEESATEFAFRAEYIFNEGQRLEYANRGGISSNYLMPFFEINQAGRGAIIAIGWTGSWKAEFVKAKDGITVRTGMKHAKFYLKPDEEVRTTSVLVMEYNNVRECASNCFRRLIRSHFSCEARRDRNKNYLLANELWGGLTSDEMIKRINEYKKHGIVFEQEWIDAGWYGSSLKCDDAFEGDWALFTGDWYMNPRIHKNAMKDVKAACEDAGMRMMLWLEPERIITGTECFKIHPEYMLRAIDKNTGEISAHCLLDLGNDKAWEYVFDTICGLVDLLNVECLRQDFNFEPETYWLSNDEPDRIGIHEIKHIMGLYRLWDELLKKYPQLMIDNCASGGRRIDIETLKRAIPFFRSDYQCEFNPEPEVTQAHGTNISRYLPYTGCTTKVKSDTYAVRSTYASSWGGAFYNTVFQTMDDIDFEWAKQILNEYKSVRRYFSMDFYNHGSESFDQTSWTIWQYDMGGSEGIIMAFRRSKSNQSMAVIYPKAISADSEYELFYYNSGEKEYLSGKSIASHGIKIILKEQRSSMLVRYRRI